MGGTRRRRWYVSLAGCRSFRWAIRVVVGWCLSSIGSTRGRKGESEARLSSWFAMSAPIFYGDGGLEVSARRWEGLLKTNTTFIVFVFVTHWLGIPLPGSPWCSPSHSPPPSVKKLTQFPLERGGVRVGGSPRLGAVGTVVFWSSLGSSSNLVPLAFLPPPFLRRGNLSHPHPSGKGRGGCSVSE